MLNAMGFQASALGNHELDQGPSAFASIFSPAAAGSATWPGADFSYLSINLDFTTHASTAPLVVADGQPAAQVLNALTGWATVQVAGQTIGLVGATTPTLRSITSPGNIGIFPADPNDLDGLAAEIQTGIDALRAIGVNKIIVPAHMQQIAIEQALATRLRGVDIIVAGGSNTRLLDGDD
jgi:2',3'-cyclic-nucleotide 2'-phosphodiesterase (5'-nucleotidase family)